jgi:hypothetical protein
MLEYRKSAGRRRCGKNDSLPLGGRVSSSGHDEAQSEDESASCSPERLYIRNRPKSRLPRSARRGDGAMSVDPQSESAHEQLPAPLGIGSVQLPEYSAQRNRSLSLSPRDGMAWEPEAPFAARNSAAYESSAGAVTSGVHQGVAPVDSRRLPPRSTSALGMAQDSGVPLLADVPLLGDGGLSPSVSNRSKRIQVLTVCVASSCS